MNLSSLLNNNNPYGAYNDRAVTNYNSIYAQSSKNLTKISPKNLKKMIDILMNPVENDEEQVMKIMNLGATIMNERVSGKATETLNMTNLLTSFKNMPYLAKNDSSDNFNNVSFGDTFSNYKGLDLSNYTYGKNDHNETWNWKGIRSEEDLKEFYNKYENLLNYNSSDDLDAYYYDPMSDNGDMNPMSMSLMNLIGQSTVLTFFASIIMFTFIYYIPRLIYFRIMRLSNEWNKTSFIPIFFLSLIAVIGSVCHIKLFYKSLTQIPLLMLFIGSRRDVFGMVLWKCACISTNQVISPLVAFVVVQQIALFSNEQKVKIILKKVFELVYCILAVVITFGWTFYSGITKFRSLEEDEDYEDDTDLSLFDVVPPIITTIAFIFMKKSVARKQIYTTGSGPDAPRTIDLVSKVIVFQQIMVIFAIVSYFLRQQEEEETGQFREAYTFFISAHTPVVHWVLMKSLLRSKRSRKICFLCCCCSTEERVHNDNTTMDGKSNNVYIVNENQ